MKVKKKGKTTLTITIVKYNKANYKRYKNY